MMPAFLASVVRCRETGRVHSGSKAGSRHMADQLELMSKNQMRPVIRQRAEVEANLEDRMQL